MWSERAVREELGVCDESEAVARVYVPLATAGGSHHPSDSINDHNIECEDTLSSKGARRLASYETLRCYDHRKAVVCGRAELCVIIRALSDLPPLSRVTSTTTTTITAAAAAVQSEREVLQGVPAI